MVAVDESIKPNTLIVYGVRATNDLSMEYRYVGLTSNFKPRLIAHMTCSTNRRSPAYNHTKYKWMRKHLHLVTFDLLGEYSTVTEMQHGEMQWIEILSNRGHRLLNGTSGGEGTYGWVPHEEWRRKQSIRMSDPEKNKYMFKPGMVQPPRSLETRKKISDAKMGLKNPRSLPVETIRSIRAMKASGVLQKDICLELGVSKKTVYRVLKGVRYADVS